MQLSHLFHLTDLYTHMHRCNNHRDGETGPPNFYVGRPTTYWSPNFLAVVLKKQEISQQVVTRMQDLASEFSKIFRGGGCTPKPSEWEGATPSRTQHSAPWCWDPNLDPPQLFSRGCTPGNTLSFCEVKLPT